MALIKSIKKKINGEATEIPFGADAENVYVDSNMTLDNVIASIQTDKANVDSPTFTGTPKAPTPSTSDNSTRLATTAYVRKYISSQGGTFHTHNNKSTLDSITSTKVSDWDGAATKAEYVEIDPDGSNSIDPSYQITITTDIPLLRVMALDDSSEAIVISPDGINVVMSGNPNTISNENLIKLREFANLTTISDTDVTITIDEFIVNGALTVGARRNVTVGSKTFVSGSSNAAGGTSSAVLAGLSNTASSNYSAVVAGNNNSASSNYSVVVAGINNSASGTNSVVVAGSNNSVSNNNSVVLGGTNNSVTAASSAILGGYNNSALEFCAVISGYNNKALTQQLKSGHYSKDGVAGNTTGTTGDAFIIGNGTSASRSNAFRVAYNGSVYGLSAFNSTGADYAEMFEWADGNSNSEDRRGLFVTFDETDFSKIRLANAGDEVIGVISATPSVIGNSYDDTWQGMYKTDIFGQPISHTVHYDAVYEEREVPDVDEEGNELETTHTEQVLVQEAYDAEEYILNPDFDSEQEYVPRSQRKEWAVVGIVGQIVVVDDGTCVAGGRCTVGSNGKATVAESGIRVLERLDDTHIRVYSNGVWTK